MCQPVADGPERRRVRPPPRPRPGVSAVIVSFPLLDEPNTSLLAWTTTPWTLPSNLGLCVHPAFDYVKVTGWCYAATRRGAARRGVTAHLRTD